MPKGGTASLALIDSLVSFAIALAQFLNALRPCDASGGPVAGHHNVHRGGALATYDTETRQAIVTLKDEINVEAVIALWEKALASTWQGSPVWVYGDLAVGNLLVEQGQLSAVIDFGQLGIGDPACDLVIAWTFFHGDSRAVFRAALHLDSATWDRSRGWALWKALCSPILSTSRHEVQRVIEAVLAG